MNGYFSRLIQQTGINVGEKASAKPYQTRHSVHNTADNLNHPEGPEPLEVEEMIEISTPHGLDREQSHSSETSVADNYNHLERPEPEEDANSIEISTLVTSDQLQTSRKTGKENQKNKRPNQESFLQKTPVEAQNNKPSKSKQVPENNSVNSTNIEKEISVPVKGSELLTEFKSESITAEETERSRIQSEIERAEIKAQVTSLSPASIEQHDYISQLPNAYRQAIEDWLITPPDGRKRQSGNIDQLKKTIKSKQHSKVTLKPDNSKDKEPVIQIGKEQFKAADLHLSVGNINITLEEPKTIKQQPPQTTSKPAPRQQAGSSRLSRHYVRVR